MYSSTKTRTINLLLATMLILLKMSCCDEEMYGGMLLTPINIDGILQKYSMVLVNFFVDWCPFSQKLQPVFNETAKYFEDSPHGKNHSVILAFIDCMQQSTLCERYKVNKYPTIKLYRYGLPGKEYRAGRSFESMKTYVETQLKDPIWYHFDQHAHNGTFVYSAAKRYIVGYIRVNEGVNNPNLDAYKKVAYVLRDDCDFVQTNLDTAEQDGVEAVKFHNGESLIEEPFNSSLTDFSKLLSWAIDICTPLVRELTFESAEEMFELGLPFFMLFHSTNDSVSPPTFRETCRTQLQDLRDKVTFLTADSSIFSHPLKYFKKTTEDLPLLVIDSFEHNYIYQNDAKEALNNSALMRSFIEDLFSEKLHKEFHNSKENENVISNSKQDADTDTDTESKDNQNVPKTPKASDSNQPIESIFRKLGPSSNRYTFRDHDEL